MKRALRLGVLALLMAYPVVLVAAAARSGVAISQDSVSYLSTATALAEGRGLTTFAGQPLTLFPPGLPILMGLAQLLGMSATTAAGVLNTVCIGLTVLGTYAVGRLALRSEWPSLAAAAVVSLSSAFLGVHVWLWTEPLFTAVVIAVLAALLWAMRRGDAPWWLVVVIGLLASAATSVRYVGYVLLPVVALGIWWAAASRGRGHAWSRVIVAVALGAVVPVALAIRNVAVGSGPLGDRYPGVRTLQDSVGDAIRVAGEYVLPPESSTLGIYLGVIMLVIVAAGVWVAVMNRDRGALLLAAFVVVYFAAIVWSQAATRLDPPSARLLAPAFPALAVLTVNGLVIVMQRISSDAAAWASGSTHVGVRRRGAQAVVVALWSVIALVAASATLASLRADVRLVRDMSDSSLGLEAQAGASALIAAASGLPDAQGLASNDPWTVYLGLDRGPVVPLPPSASEWPQERLDRDRTALLDGIRSGEVTHALVFAAGSATEPLGDLTEAGVSAELVLQTPEGSVYRFTSADTIAE